uniref:Indoleamine 2,3-dioxygenase n=1 Tax=Periglandula ipomoeae TaxID=1037530 RepID=J7FID3_9HYPO|nr:indoleamine 2,3-dioxygenase [Periglandula ipomoeae]
MSLSTLADFGITAQGLLPSNDTLHFLPDPYYKPWDIIALSLPELIPKGIRKAVHQLQELSTDRLTSEEHNRWAYVRLAFITQAYIWGGEQSDDVQTHLPPQLAIPFIQVSRRLDLPPVITYAATCLWNFKCDGGDITKPETIKSLVTFTGEESESWFFGISVAIEARGAHTIPVLMDSLAAAERDCHEQLISTLGCLRRCIEDLIHLLERMYEKCDATTFYHKIRPFLAGSKGMERLPNGVFYDEGDGKGEWKQLRGGSNGQSTLLQLFDKFLGIRHESNEDDTAGFHEEMKQYMPSPHRRLLVEVERKSTVRELAMSLPITHELRVSYKSVIDAMSQLRGRHMNLVARYIIVPSNKSQGSTIGTAGTSPMLFLRQTRKSTVIAGTCL